MKKIFKNIVILVIVILLTLIFARLIGNLYFVAFPKESAGSFVGSVDLVGVPLAYIFSLTFLFTAFGGTKKYWFIGIALIPAVLFEVAFDLQHIYFPIAIGLVGWLLGKGVGLITKKFNTSPGSPPPPRQ